MTRQTIRGPYNKDENYDRHADILGRFSYARLLLMIGNNINTTKKFAKYFKDNEIKGGQHPNYNEALHQLVKNGYVAKSIDEFGRSRGQGKPAYKFTLVYSKLVDDVIEFLLQKIKDHDKDPAVTAKYSYLEKRGYQVTIEQKHIIDFLQKGLSSLTKEALEDFIQHYLKYLLPICTSVGKFGSLTEIKLKYVYDGFIKSVGEGTLFEDDSTKSDFTFTKTPKQQEIRTANKGLYIFKYACSLYCLILWDVYTKTGKHMLTEKAVKSLKRYTVVKLNLYQISRVKKGGKTASKVKTQQN